MANLAKKAGGLLRRIHPVTGALLGGMDAGKGLLSIHDYLQDKYGNKRGASMQDIKGWMQSQNYDPKGLLQAGHNVDWMGRTRQGKSAHPRTKSQYVNEDRYPELSFDQLHYTDYNYPYLLPEGGLLDQPMETKQGLKTYHPQLNWSGKMKWKNYSGSGYEEFSSPSAKIEGDIVNVRGKEYINRRGEKSELKGWVLQWNGGEGQELFDTKQEAKDWLMGNMSTLMDAERHSGNYSGYRIEGDEKY